MHTVMHSGVSKVEPQMRVFGSFRVNAPDRIVQFLAPGRPRPLPNPELHTALHSGLSRAQNRAQYCILGAPGPGDAHSTALWALQGPDLPTVPRSRPSRARKGAQRYILGPPGPSNAHTIAFWGLQGGN